MQKLAISILLRFQFYVSKYSVKYNKYYHKCYKSSLTFFLDLIFISISAIMLFCLVNSYASVSTDEYVLDNNLKFELITEGLKSPVGMAFLGQDDILVSEKGGKVQRIVNNKILQVPALDITSIINRTGERGLLGIAVSEANLYKDFDIYLFYTEHISKTENFNSDCVLEKCDRNDLLVNSLYKYKFQTGELVNPELLFRIPVDGKPGLFHIGGIITLGPDNRIYITSGDGNICTNPEECQIAINDGHLNSQTANVGNGNRPLGSGGILYFNLDNNITNYKPVLGYEYPLSTYYAYGIRNSFGLDFDPVTGYLWDTENGPAFGDEINLVEPGFNSGWAKRQGIWSITDYGQLATDPPQGEERGYHFSENQEIDGDYEVMVDFNGIGQYSEPEFTWNYPVGVTSIEFFDSDQYGEKYKNDMFVSTFNGGGTIYNFNLENDRKSLDLKGSLEDKVANTDEELDDVIFARNPGAITDLETGPDGLLYVLSIGEGKIWRIVPSEPKNS